MTTITLAGQAFEIAPLPFGKLRKLLSSFNLMVRAGMESDRSLAEAAKVFALLIDKTPDEVDAMAITMTELVAALGVIPGLCGIEQGAASGEAQVVAMDSTASTAT